jgi:hypothetical protein
MRSKLSFLAILVLASFQLQALSLTPFPDAHDPSVASPDQPIPCDQVINAMADLQQKLSAHETSLTTFLGQVSQRLRDYAAQLAKFENSPDKIPVGTFSVLTDGADKTDTITNDAFDNTDYVTSQMARIVSAARACKITSVPAVSPQK